MDLLLSHLLQRFPRINVPSHDPTQFCPVGGGEAGNERCEAVSKNWVTVKVKVKVVSKNWVKVKVESATCVKSGHCGELRRQWVKLLKADALGEEKRRQMQLLSVGAKLI